MNRIPCAAAVAAFCLALPVGAVAQSPTPAAPLNDVTVTATRTPVALNDALAHTIVIDRQEIEDSGATSIVDVLRRYAGLDIAQLGGPGQPAAMFMRGGNSNYTVVMIDGIRVSDSGSGAIPLQDITPEMVERIEVVEGPRSTLYGADAVGGVINVITRKPGPGELEVVAGGGSYDTASGAAAVRYQGTAVGLPWGVAFNAQQQHSGGFPAIAGTDTNDQYRNRTFNGRANLDLGRVQLEARAWDATGNNQYENFVFDNSPPFGFLGFAPVSKDFHDQILALQARGKVTQAWTSSVTLSHSLTHFDQIEMYAPTHVNRPEANWHNVVAAGRHNRVSFGARFQNERIFQFTGFSTIRQNIAEDYGYLQDELDYGRNHAVGAVSYLHNGRFGERFNWNASYGFDLFTDTRLIASAGSAFRAPTLVDLFYPGASNPDLQPEKALNYEVAVRQQLTTAQDVELRLFRTDVRDLIIFNGMTFKPENAQRAQMQGVQLTWRYVDAKWNAQFRGVYQDARNRSTHTQLVRRPRFTVSARVDRTFQRFNVGAGIYGTGRRPDVDLLTGASGPEFADGGYALLDLHAGVRVMRGLQLQVSLKNAFNHHYQTAHGYNQSSSAVFGTVRYSVPL